MIISVWNNDNQSIFFDNGKVLTTLIASCGALAGMCTVTMLENSMSGGLIGDTMYGKNYSDKLSEDESRCYNRSEDRSITDFFSKNYLKNTKYKRVVELVEHGLYYIPQYIEKNDDSFEEKFSENMYEYFDQAEKISEYTIVATAKSGQHSTMDIIDCADIILVLLPLREQDYVRFFSAFGQVAENCIFVSMVHENTDIKVARRIMGSLKIDKDRFFVLRYDDDFELNRDGGKVFDYMKKQIENPTVPASVFIKDITSLTGKLFSKKYQRMYMRGLAMSSLLKKRHAEKSWDENQSVVYHPGAEPLVGKLLAENRLGGEVLPLKNGNEKS